MNNNQTQMQELKSYLDTGIKFPSALNQVDTNDCSSDFLMQSVFDDFNGISTIFERIGHFLYLVDNNSLFQLVNLPKFVD
jgi:hypothetical protein